LKTSHPPPEGSKIYFEDIQRHHHIQIYDAIPVMNWRETSLHSLLETVKHNSQTINLRFSREKYFDENVPHHVWGNNLGLEL
jgi:hypothetical protein